MERLTKLSSYVGEHRSNVYALNPIYVSGKRDYFNGKTLMYTGNAVQKLAEYENTGLEPSEVEYLKRELAVYKKALLKNIRIDIEMERQVKGTNIRNGCTVTEKEAEYFDLEEKLDQSRKEIENECRRNV